MSYATKDIRNICLFGHGGSGKTTLTESLLYCTGAIDRQGRVPDGNTVCDYDAEETRRQITISAAIAPIEFGGVKINVLDCPGYFDFASEAAGALRVCETGLLLLTAKDGISVGAERGWKMLKKAAKPTMFYISKLDEDNGDFDAVLSSLQSKYGTSVCAVTAPLSDGSGVMDLVHDCAYTTKGAKTTKIAIPDADRARADELREVLMEAAATTEELMEKYLDEMELNESEIVEGLRAGVLERSVFPVLCGSAISALGSQSVLSAISEYAPSPDMAPPVKTVGGEDIACDPLGTTTAFVFKTLSDQFGKYSIVKVIAGKITPDHALRNSRTDNVDKLGRLYTLTGKKNAEVKELVCGDIGAIGKMDYKTGDTLVDSRTIVELPRIETAEPVYSMAIAPKVKGQEEKIGTGLARLNEEDISFTVVNNPETHQLVLSGAGDIQLDVLCAKLRNRFGVESELTPARVPYREKIKKKVEAHGRHKKQSGGSGQFGDVWIRFEPQFDDNDLVFAEEVFGGSVPRNFFPAVEKGLRESIHHGVLAGYPMVNLKATLYDGSYHPVDSNEIAFKTAAQLAYKDGIPKAQPTLLEPIGILAVNVPSDNMGDVIGDLNKRRGRVMGMNPDDDGNTVIDAEVPMAEMSSYAIDLRSMSQGRGSFVFKFDRYEEAPGNIQQKIIEEAKALAEE
ncbi:MAG: elongation factor G [Oscillospiraceae bacterium]|jgi:elongation factor G|nr:elongation factor G [Oscillospiraceae bacterium]